MAQAYQCPSCGAPVNFASLANAYAVCAYCRAMLVRHDMDLDNLGKMAQLMDDSSPLQIGTTGVFKKMSFSLIGRLQQVWDQGYWNEWHMLISKKERAWLAEAQGFYGLCFEQSKITPPAKEKIAIGYEMKMGGRVYEVTDIKEVVTKAWEGELPSLVNPNSKFLSVDLSAEEPYFASFNYHEKGADVFLGVYKDFEALQFRNLRELEDW